MQNDNAEFESAIQAVSNAVAEALKLAQPKNDCGQPDCKSDENVLKLIAQAYVKGFNKGVDDTIENIPYELYIDREDGCFRYEGDIELEGLADEVSSSTTRINSCDVDAGHLLSEINLELGNG